MHGPAGGSMAEGEWHPWNRFYLIDEAHQITPEMIATLEMQKGGR